MGETRKEMNKSVASSAGLSLSGRILVVDDDRPVLDLVSQYLEFLGFEVGLAGNGLEALSLFLQSPFDLVLTDFQMPAMDGLRLARHIKDRSPRTPVILLTGSDRETVQKKVERGPVDSVIFKPFRLKDLQTTIQGALELRE